jgi:hypothetical protein
LLLRSNANNPSRCLPGVPQWNPALTVSFNIMALRWLLAKNPNFRLTQSERAESKARPDLITTIVATKYIAERLTSMIACTLLARCAIYTQYAPLRVWFSVTVVVAMTCLSHDPQEDILFSYQLAS